MFSHLLYPLDWTNDAVSCEKPSKCARDLRTAWGVWTSGRERNTTSVWSNELLQTEERERNVELELLQICLALLCWWMRKWICKPSLKWCSDTNRSAGNWFTRKLQRLKTVSLCSVISFSCLNVWGRRREFFEVFKDMLRRGMVCRSMRSHYYKSTPFKLKLELSLNKCCACRFINSK